MKLLSLLHFLEVNLTSFPPKCFFQKNKIEIFKTIPNSLFSLARLFCKKSIRHLAIEKGPIISELQITFLSRELLTPHFVAREFFCNICNLVVFSLPFFFSRSFFTQLILTVQLKSDNSNSRYNSQ